MTESRTSEFRSSVMNNACPDVFLNIMLEKSRIRRLNSCQFKHKDRGEGGWANVWHLVIFADNLQLTNWVSQVQHGFASLYEHDVYLPGQSHFNHHHICYVTFCQSRETNVSHVNIIFPLQAFIFFHEWRIWNLIVPIQPHKEDSIFCTWILG